MTAHCTDSPRRRSTTTRELFDGTWFVACALAMCCLDSAAQSPSGTYPSRPIRIVVPFAPGGSTDFFARSIGQKLTEVWAQQVVVDNRTGANGIVGTDIVAKAAPDGYTLLMNAIGHAANASLYAKLPYDTVRDFAAVTSFADVPMFIVVHPQVKASSVSELIALARSKPGALNCAAGGVGASHHLAAELFRSAAKIEWQYVQYRGGAPALTEVIAGNTHLTFTPISSALHHVTSGRLRAIAVTSPKRVPIAPDLPTIAESGLPGYEARAWYGLVAPARVPKEIVVKLNREINELLRTPAFRDALLARGAIPMGGTVEEFSEFLRNEIDKYAVIVKRAGIRGE